MQAETGALRSDFVGSMHDQNDINAVGIRRVSRAGGATWSSDGVGNYVGIAAAGQSREGTLSASHGKDALFEIGSRSGGQAACRVVVDETGAHDLQPVRTAANGAASRKTWFESMPGSHSSDSNSRRPWASRGLVTYPRQVVSKYMDAGKWPGAASSARPSVSCAGEYSGKTRRRSAWAS
jgi:hypothetical protein